MALTPFAAGSAGTRRTAESFTTMRRDLEDLQRQLATGQRSDTFSGLGLGRRTSLDVRAKLSAIAGYQEGIANGSLRLQVMNKGLESVTKAIGQQKAQSTPPSFEPGGSGQTPMQRVAMANLRHAVDVLNANVNGRYLYGGRADDKPPVADVDAMLNGDATGRGLIAVIADMKAADRGTAASPGLLTVGGSGALTTLTETSATNGFEIPAQTPLGSASISASVSGAAGSRALSFTVNTVPAEGEAVSFELGLRDGTTLRIALTARAGSPAADARSFQIGATAATTGDNLRAAVDAAVRDALPALDAASAMRATTAFFDGTAPGAMTWYKGEGVRSVAPPDPLYSVTARNGVPLRVDTAQSVGVGARANEAGFTNMLAGFAVMAAETFSTDPAKRDGEAARYAALAARSTASLDPPADKGNLRDIVADLGYASAALDGAKSRHQSAKVMWENAIAGVEKANDEEVAASILSLQTRLQASYQTTSILSKLSMVNYL
ncbi:hypothetical protein [Salinarimonas soli]|uniref:Uncharacterized protein n=1 Tax=Salinarimonas soli TaxID=1638099 RepID=A0A5B2VGW4_9HYPH|nr:hypothetical protein [Salinarimonas soli]KAA2237579.1 hypothetical protein F0L46_11405 [Salinarimonas soli]